MEETLENFLGDNYKRFISSIKKHICSKVKMGQYKDFFEGLNIQALLLVDSNGIDKRSASSESLLELLDAKQLPTSYLITEEKVTSDESVIEYTKNKINKDDFKLKKVHTAEVTGNSSKVAPYRYDLCWFVDQEESFNFVEKRIAKTILEILGEKVDSIDMIASPKKLFREISFMKKYYEILKKEFKFPDKELFSEIAYRTYENRENQSIMCFVEKENIEDTETVIKFTELSIDENGFRSGNENNMRKLLEISKPSYEGDERKCLLFSLANKQCWGLALEKDISKSKHRPFVYFYGQRKWEIRYDEKVIIQCNNNEFSFDESTYDELWKKKLPRKIKENKNFIKLVHCLERQRHGALVVIANDAEAETERLCDKCKRGTKIEKLKFSDENALSIISGFCSVDGAIFVDFEGCCYGYGVLLDGVAKIEGDRGRGARYNSALNYIAESERYAIVVSEDKDKGIEILSSRQLKKRMLTT